MDATLKLKAEQLAGEIATQAKRLDDVNGLVNTFMKSALERMLDTEMDVHLGRKTIAASPRRRSARAARLLAIVAMDTPPRPSAATSASSPSTRPAIGTAPSSRS